MPKSLVKLDDRTMLEVQIEQLSIAGIDRKDITVITGYKNNLFSKHGLMTQNNEHYSSTGQVYSISCGTNYSNQKEVIIIYGDILFEAKLIDAIKLTDSNFIVPSFKNFKKLWQERGDCDFDDLETFIQDSDHKYFKYVVPFSSRLSRPLRNIYTYAFSMNPINVEPSGMLDFSQLQSNRTVLDVTMEDGLTSDYTLHLYYVGYQTFIFENGVMALV